MITKCKYCGRSIQSGSIKEEICVFCKSVFQYMKNNPKAGVKIMSEMEEKCKGIQ